MKYKVIVDRPRHFSSMSVVHVEHSLLVLGLPPVFPPVRPDTNMPPVGKLPPVLPHSVLVEAQRFRTCSTVLSLVDVNKFMEHVSILV